MGNIFDLNVTKVEKGKFSSNLGTAHEFYATGILMRLGFDVSVSSVKGGSYDVLITVFENGYNSESRIIKAQVKTTAGNSLKFIGGIRGGADRAYTSTTKQLVDKSYKYSPELNDLVIGINKATGNMYLVPTVFLKHFGKSISTNRISVLKNNWEILLNWNSKFLRGLLKKV